VLLECSSRALLNTVTHQIGRVEGTVSDDNDFGDIIAGPIAGVVNSLGERLGRAPLLLSVAYARSAPHLPAYRQGPPPVGQRPHPCLPLAGKLGECRQARESGCQK